MTPTTTWQVLLADDVADLRLSVKMILEAYGPFEVVGEVGDGRAAIEEAERLQPDLILLDLSMPKMDGLEALPEILAVAPETEVIIFSGFVEGRLGPKIRELGGLGYIEKGIEPEDLVLTVLELLGEPPPDREAPVGAKAADPCDQDR